MAGYPSKYDPTLNYTGAWQSETTRKSGAKAFPNLPQTSETITTDVTPTRRAHAEKDGAKHASSDGSYDPIARYLDSLADHTQARLNGLTPCLVASTRGRPFVEREISAFDQRFNLHGSAWMEITEDCAIELVSTNGHTVSTESIRLRK